MWRCRIGWHDWDEPEQPDFGDRRRCRRCAKVQELVEDGVWNTGNWVTVSEDDEDLP